ncbi:SDR family oxidoreductase [Metabacillus sp. GX 13764]|uniref:SDR family NAD(P)-dependent oxidoreductase n=1 Tax=Metabacillus kandeliae TaxID=2900151 RepID=UPI001E43B4C0|nr:SDR family oxidoreductase [Metabacillus kandeliae]
MSIFSKEALAGSHILITGATGGIGLETAIACAETGANVTLTGRNGEKLEKARQACVKANDNVKIFTCPADLADPLDRSRLTESARNELGPITGLVNAAGISGGNTLDQLEEADLRRVMELNYMSAILLTQDVYKDMMEHKQGAVVNVSSLSGLRGTHGGTSYAGSKFAMIGFTQSFALEAIEYGVRVNAVCPGYVDTEMGRNAIKRRGEKEGRRYEDQLKIAEEGIPSGRISTAEEVANSIVFLLTDAARNIVGESLKISGGVVMR